LIFGRNKRGPEAAEKMRFWQERLKDNEDIPARALDELRRQQANRVKYLLLQSDPEAFDYENDEDYNGYFSLVTVEATVVRRNGAMGKLTPQRILDRPHLTTIYDFEKHSSTIAEAIEKAPERVPGTLRTAILTTSHGRLMAESKICTGISLMSKAVSGGQRTKCTPMKLPTRNISDSIIRSTYATTLNSWTQSPCCVSTLSAILTGKSVTLWNVILIPRCKYRWLQPPPEKT
jgi:hypothetical protein